MSELSPDRIIKIGYAYREAKALLSAVELGVFTALSGQALDAEQLRDRIGIERRCARDFFDALVALELLNSDDAGRYSNTAEISALSGSPQGDISRRRTRVHQRPALRTLERTHRRAQDGAAADRRHRRL